MGGQVRRVGDDATLDVKPGCCYGLIILSMGEEIPPLGYGWQLLELFFPPAIVIGTFGQAIGIPMLGPWTVFHAEVVFFERHDPSTYQGFVSVIGFEP